MDQDSQSLTLDATILRYPVRRALGSAKAEVETWEVHPLGQGFNPVTGGVYRIRGTARDQGKPTHWSLVLKVCRNPGSSADADPQAGNYWKREFLAYSSGLLDKLPLGIRAPRCYGTQERSADEAWLWLENLNDVHGSSWPLARYGLAARHAGQFNGAYLTGRPSPTAPWLRTGVARQHVEQWGAYLERLPEFADHPLVKRNWPDAGTADRIVRLWQERETFLEALARLPQTLNHLDFFKLNLFAVSGADGSDETAALDWSYIGTAAVGEELAPLVCASPSLAGEHADRVRELGELAFECYLSGLHDVGWQGDNGLARLGYTAGTIRYALIAMGLIGAIEPEIVAGVERAWGPFGEILDRSALGQQYTLDLADEARELIRVLL